MPHATFFMLFAKKTPQKFVSPNKCRTFALAIGKQRYRTVEKQIKLVP